MEKKRHFRHFDNDGDSYLYFNQFLEYCQSMYNNIQYIEKYYRGAYNKKSSHTIEAQKKYFELCIKAFYEVCYKERKNANAAFLNILSPENQTYYYLQRLSYSITNRDDFYTKDDITNLIIINPTYYKKIESITNRIFQLEENMSQITSTFWSESLAKSVEDIKNGKFACLAKVLIEWRKDNETDELSKYMTSRYAMSVSYITNHKSRFFGERNETAHRVGILYYADKILAGLHTDAYLEEFIDGKCPLKRFNVYTNIQKTDVFDNHAIYSFANKIATPKSVLFTGNDDGHGTTYNEVIIDKRSAKPFAVFCIRKINEEYVDNYQQALRTAQKMAERFNLPVVELDSKNEFENQDEETLHIENL